METHRRNSYPMMNNSGITVSPTNNVSRDLLQDAMMISNLNNTFVNDQLLIQLPDNNESLINAKLIELENTI